MDVEAVAPFNVLVPARRLDQVLVGQEPEDCGDDDADSNAVDEYHIQQKLKENCGTLQVFVYFTLKPSC